MKLILKTAKPRNPLVVVTLRRKAGCHRLSRGAERRQAAWALRHELGRLESTHPHP